MNDARVDHIEEALTGLDHKVDGLGAQLADATTRLDSRIDGLGVDLRAEMKAGFEEAFHQTQGGFDDHRAFSEFLTSGLRDEMNKRFNQVERRFDRMDNRFDRLETLINGQTPPPKTQGS